MTHTFFLFTFLAFEEIKRMEIIENEDDLNEVEISEEEINERKKWIEDAEKSVRIWFIFIETFVVTSVVLLVALGAVSYQYNLNWLFDFYAQPNPGNIGSRLLLSMSHIVSRIRLHCDQSISNHPKQRC